MSKKRVPFTFPSDSEAMRNRGQSQNRVDNDANRKYQDLSKAYANEEYTFECHQFINSICRSIRGIEHLQGFPVREILLVVSRKLMLNELEFLFLSCLLEQLKWPIQDDTVKNHASNLKNIIRDADESVKIKCLQLYVLLAAYSVKVYLNEDIKMFEAEMNDLLPKFQQIFQTWGNKFAKIALIINPKNLNSKYMLYTTKRDEHPVHHQDLNSKVNELLQNTPASEVPRRSKKKQEQSHEDPSVEQSNNQKQEDDLPPQRPLSRNPSGYNNDYFPNNQLLPQDSIFLNGMMRQNSLDLMMMSRNPGMMRSDSVGSDFYGMNRNLSIERQSNQ